MNIFVLFTSLLTSAKNFAFIPVSQPRDEAIVREVSAFEDLKNPLYFTPQELDLNIKGKSTKLEVEEIGLDGNDQLGVPQKWQSAGWYRKSAKPGEKGTVIIDGHYDTNTGNPAAFWALKSIGVNDKVILKDKLNRSFTYKVTNTFNVDIDDPNRLQVFEESNNPTLTLITCGGVWDYTSGTYNKRLVVKANLVSSDLD